MLPVKARWAQQHPCTLVMESTTRLDIARDMGVETLSLGCDPIYDCTFHSLCIISTGTISAFLNLPAAMSMYFYWVTGHVSIPDLR